MEWESWNWDLWNTPLEPDDDEDSLDLIREKVREAEEEPWQNQDRATR